jgi:hypothetical protein
MSLLSTATTLGGLAWDPGIRGILSVFLGFVILCGSIYVILATNTGARLGLLLSAAGLSGWMVILTLFWWLSPPGIGPSGPLPSWTPLEIHYNAGDDPFVTDVANDLPSTESYTERRQQILADNPEIAETFPLGGTLSDLAGDHPELVEDLDLAGWEIVTTSEAGEAQAAADAVLAERNVFSDTTEYRKLEVFEIGGKPDREDVPDDEWFEEMWTRITYKLDTIVNFKHPPHYVVVQVQRVVPQEARAGEAPPLPEIDPEQPVVSVVMVRDLGNQRGLPATYFVISLAFFIIFVLMLHYRDRTLDRNLAAAKAAKAAKKG